jgi:uncharacterized membrane protein YcaP (DUF421 family)
MYLKIISKTLFLYFFIILVYRIMGKKEVGKLGIVDLIVSILIAELAALSIEEYDGSILVSVIPILCLVVVQIIFGYFGLKSSKLRNMLDGKPAVIIKNGKLNFKEMVKLRYSLDDLVSQLREQGIMNIEDVNYAVLENNGKLSVFKEEKNYPLPLILDGQIDYSVLKEIKKNEKWLNLILEKNKIALNNVFYAFYTKEKTFIIKKQDVL